MNEEITSLSKKYPLIKCPKCSREYLPSEIFIPDAFIGKGLNVKRDENGKIISYEGNPTDMTEKFVCEGCNTPFKVTTKIQFLTQVDSDLDFSEDYKTTTKISLFMDEE